MMFLIVVEYANIRAISDVLLPEKHVLYEKMSRFFV